ncbi:alpha/beta-Hydrolases superfamily protein [Rhynchospora pubera]|uniref:Alpha/beta-Hydrolases superfamily protein n=1 Tax=Rhynchospora pubera TaxID=906938 RepID=A0AAV8BQL1_9POAL|nr:alpha/beta-Hydrolases superfamily protein [Rhynchospora pubera]
MWKQWKGKKPLPEVIDSCLHENCAMDQITRCCVIGLLCVQLDPKRRLGMELVLEMLHSNIDLPTPSFPGFFQEYEYARPPDSHSHIEIEPVKYERPEDTRTSRLEPSFFQEYSLEDLMIVNSPETEEAYYALHGVSGSSAHFTAPSGRYLFTRSWVPLVSPPRALICMIHSFGDDTSWTMQFTSIFLASQGFACFAADLPGHGRSPGRRAFVPKVNLVLADLKDFFQSLRSRPENQGLKSFLFGESMGGALCLLMLLSMPADAWAGAVLVAPLCKISNRIKPPRPVQMALRFVSMFAPTLPVISYADLVEKSVKVPEKRVLAMSNPMRYNGKTRVGTMLKLLRISDELGSRLHEVSIPFLVLHGSADEVLDPADSMALYEEARSEDKTIKIYDGMLHSLLFGEPDKNVAMVRRNILNWLNERCPNQHEIHIERM